MVTRPLHLGPRLRLLAAGLWLAALGATAQADTARVDLPLLGSRCNARVQDVSSVWAYLRLPTQAAAPMPVVVLMHSNAGVIGVGEFYAQALRGAGIATLELDSFTPRGVRNGNDRHAPVLCDRLQEAWGALAWLAQDSRFDPDRIGIAGFSSGGALALLTAMGVRPARMDRSGSVLSPERVYAAHFALYPACANLMDDPQRIRAWIDPGRPQNWGATGKPVHIVSGTQDDFDFSPTTDCLRMGSVFPAIASQLTVRMVEGATHAFDWPTPPPPTHSPFAKAQTGGLVHMRYSPADAAQTRAEMVSFFRERLRAAPLPAPLSAPAR